MRWFVEQPLLTTIVVVVLSGVVVLWHRYWPRSAASGTGMFLEWEIEPDRCGFFYGVRCKGPRNHDGGHILT